MSVRSGRKFKHCCGRRAIAHSDPSERPVLVRRFLAALGEALVRAGSSSVDQGTAVALDGFARLTRSIDPMSDWSERDVSPQRPPRLSILGQRPGCGRRKCRGAAERRSSGARAVAVVDAESQLPAAASWPRVSRELWVRGHRRPADGRRGLPWTHGWRLACFSSGQNSLPPARPSGGRDLLPHDR